MNRLIIDERYIQSKIFTFRNHQVMLDSDLADLYQIETKVLNQAVKRNIKRFPKEFMFQLTKEEYDKIKGTYLIPHNEQENYEGLRSQNVTLKNFRGKHRKYLPYVFTETGVAMLSAVLKSEVAVEMSIKIMSAFVNMRKFLLTNAAIFQKFEHIEQKLSQHDKNFEVIFKAIENKNLKPRQGIFLTDKFLMPTYLLVI